MMWTRAQLMTAMRRKGWKRMDGHTGWYEHQETGYRVDLDRYNEKANKPEWKVWAEAEKTPPPF